MGSWKFFLLLTIAALAIQAFFSMLEMALVSFNKVRLQYYLEKESRKAKWINHLLNHPAKLFGTTLIGVNFALQFGSECSRRFYESLQLSPDLAPLTQVFIVLIFAELSPMFAARRYAEHVCMIGIPIIYFSSIVMAPIIWFFDKICLIFHKIFGLSPVLGNYLTREELQKAIEARGEKQQPESEEFDHIVSNIFSLKMKFTADLLLSFEEKLLIPSFFTIEDLKLHSKRHPGPYYLVYEGEKKNVIGVAYTRDFIRLSNKDPVRPYSRTPWFITEQNSIMQIIKQFRWNKQNLAVVVDESGFTKGILTLDAIIREIFKGEIPDEIELKPLEPKIMLDRTFPGSTLIYNIQEELHIPIEGDPSQSLEDLLAEKLHHHPVKGDYIYYGDLILTVVDAPMIGEMQINVKTSP